MCSKRNYIVSFAEEDMEKVTREFNFRVSNDIKKLSLNSRKRIQLEEELLTLVNSNQLGVNIHQSECGKYTVRKSRHKNPSNNRGKSSGYRLITLFLEFEDEEDIFCTVFHIYSKTGPHAKSNLSDTEKNQCQKFIEYLINNYEGE